MAVCNSAAVVHDLRNGVAQITVRRQIAIPTVSVHLHILRDWYRLLLDTMLLHISAKQRLHRRQNTNKQIKTPKIEGQTILEDAIARSIYVFSK